MQQKYFKNYYSKFSIYFCTKIRLLFDLYFWYDFWYSVSFESTF